MPKLKVLAVVPARGGSKGVPGKNIRPLAGLPLIGWTLRAAKESGVVDRLVVSTDSAEIAKVSESLSVPVPWLRPAEFARDHSPSIDLVLHALDQLKGEGWIPDAVLLLQPTSPFRSAATIREAAKAYSAAEAESLVSVSPAAEHPWKCFFMEPAGKLRRAVPDAPETARRQDLPPAYATDGAIYLDSPEFLRRRRAFTGPGTIGFVTPEAERLDIDTPEDWAEAERLAERMRR